MNLFIMTENHVLIYCFSAYSGCVRRLIEFPNRSIIFEENYIFMPNFSTNFSFNPFHSSSGRPSAFAAFKSDIDSL